MNITFRDWFFRQFPEQDQTNDSYKDANNEGVWQRYLRGYGMELDEEIVPFIDNFVNIIDAQIADAKFLPHIASTLGMPPSLGADPDLYRKVLAYALSIYKVKGTKKSFEIFFNLLGLGISIMEDIPQARISYDMDLIIYDEDNVYDTECDYCSGYRIGYYSILDGDQGIPHTVVPQETLDKAAAVICFLQPINAKFVGYVKALTIRDSFIPDITEIFNP